MSCHDPDPPHEATLPQLPARPTWHSPLLSFYDKVLEGKYRKHFLNQAIDVDRRVARWHLIFVSAMFVIFLVKTILLAPHWDKDFRPIALYSAALSFVALHWSWLETAKRETLVRWRNIAVGGIRFAFAALVLLASGPSFQQGVLITTHQACWQKAIYRTGVVAAVWPALGFQLVFKHHLLVQTLVVLVLMKLAGKGFCYQAIWSDGILAQRAQELDEQICQAGGTTSSSCPLSVFSSVAHMGVLYRWMTAAHRMLTITGQSSSPLSPAMICSGTVLFLQLGLGWWLPTVVLYMFERKSRAHYLCDEEKEHEVDLSTIEAERKLEQSRRWGDRFCRLMRWLVVLLQVCVSLMVSWHLTMYCLLGGEHELS